MSETIAPGSLSVSRTSGTVPKARRRRSSGLKWIFALVLLAAAAGGGYRYFNRANNKPLEFRTSSITRGDITQTVTANGQLTPVKNVQVGSQISGTITEINVDYNSKVKEGQVIAKIDPAMYERNLAQVDAELSNAGAALELAELNFKRAKELHANKLISEAEYNQAEVSLHQAQAVVKMREANVDRAKVDLSRTTIYAPIDGVVISRNIEVGQTVAASFNTPTLFLIANDLAKMQIEAAVSEADVGGVEENQPVNFKVEAFPTREFRGVVKQVRYQPVTNQNVVTYTTIVDVDNADLKLRPGMTANASIITAQKRGTLRIPNAVFRFRPPEGATVLGASSSTTNSNNSAANTRSGSASSSELPTPPWRLEQRRPNPGESEKWEATLTPEQRDQYQRMREQMRARIGEGGGRGGSFGGVGGAFASAARSNSEGPRTLTVYTLEKDKPALGQAKPVLKPLPVKVGISDGTNTEVIEGLNEGDVVVASLATPESPEMAGGMRASGTGTTPFGSPFGRGRAR